MWEMDESLSPSPSHSSLLNWDGLPGLLASRHFLSHSVLRPPLGLIFLKQKSGESLLLKPYWLLTPPGKSPAPLLGVITALHALLCPSLLAPHPTPRSVCTVPPVGPQLHASGSLHMLFPSTTSIRYFPARPLETLPAHQT